AHQPAGPQLCRNVDPVLQSVYCGEYCMDSTRYRGMGVPMSMLDAVEQELMRTELGSLLRRAMVTGDWIPYQEALDGWIATADLKDVIDTSLYQTPDSYVFRGESTRHP